jgi:hypothetical protein
MFWELISHAMLAISSVVPWILLIPPHHGPGQGLPTMLKNVASLI